VRLFGRKRDDEPVDMNERSPQLGLKYKDLMVLDQLMKSGADLTASRHKPSPTGTGPSTTAGRQAPKRSGWLRRRRFGWGPLDFNPR
jgi:hypothetical protein